MKKALSLLLVLSLLLAVPSIAFAAGGDDGKEEIRVVDTGGHGQYTIPRGIRALMSSDNDAIATATDIDESIYYIAEQDRYLVEVFEDNYLLTERIDITSPEELQTLEAEEKIIPEAVANLEEAFQQQRALGNNDFYVSAFVPAPLDNTELRVSTYAGENPVKTEAFYTYNGYNMRDTNFKYTSSHVELKKEGSGALEVAKAAKNLIISLLGGKVGDNLIIPLFGKYKSAYDLYAAIHGGVSYGSSGDYINTLVNYDKVEKYTAIALEPNAWVVGGISRRVWLKEQTTTQLYVDKGKIESTNEPLGELKESVHYQNPAAYVDKSGKLEITFNDQITYEMNGVTGYL